MFSRPCLRIPTVFSDIDSWINTDDLADIFEIIQEATQSARLEIYAARREIIKGRKITSQWREKLAYSTEIPVAQKATFDDVFLSMEESFEVEETIASLIEEALGELDKGDWDDERWLMLDPLTDRRMALQQGRLRLIGSMQ